MKIRSIRNLFFIAYILYAPLKTALQYNDYFCILTKNLNLDSKT